eukprot:gnl/Spiro4/10458_TR5598_c0_g1_i1.p1 gnl/Spiro4/10458_TR5598_c0_g1~~gnl/Spiro4/10458_TR5598_c0_g1_i1.p1  ORF type:complete len:156 (+),score=36.59 gnl/Spiro4/10458_TR5598_c0_g1_i1:34-468(+)
MLATTLASRVSRGFAPLANRCIVTATTKELADTSDYKFEFVQPVTQLLIDDLRLKARDMAEEEAGPVQYCKPFFHAIPRDTVAGNVEKAWVNEVGAAASAAARGGTTHVAYQFQEFVPLMTKRQATPIPGGIPNYVKPAFAQKE